MSIPTISEILNPNRKPKLSKAMKADRTLHRITFTPSTAKPGETLYVYVPKLNENMVFVPKSMFLRFNIKIEKGHAENHLVQNVSRNLVNHMKIFFEGKTICDTDRYDILHGYHDMLTCVEDVKRGIMSEDKRKAMAAGNGDAKLMKQTSTTYGKRYHIPLSHPVLDDHGVFYQKELKSNLRSLQSLRFLQSLQ